MTARATIPDRSEIGNSVTDLSQHTYMVRYNPNCASRFEVRTCGDAFMVDAGERRNFVSYGKSLEEAMAKAAAKIEHSERCKRVLRAERSIAGLVWA
jgi:hypothetical protein